MRFAWFIRFAVISFLIVTYYCIWECLTLGVIYMFSGNEQIWSAHKGHTPKKWDQSNKINIEQKLGRR